ncbi:MAG: ABC transporter ATP-binding protein [Chloroflexi bacterium]|nr:MAG: ABC transporter ATP-binding protein [Chloroflexota bacterium]
MAVIEARGLSIDYRIGKVWQNAIRDVALRIEPLQIHGLVGESGSGKSTLGLALMRYLASNARIKQGEILFEGHDLVPLSDVDMRQIWGHSISLVPQDPLSALNPAFTIGEQMAEVTRLHRGFSQSEAWQHATEMLRQVKIADPEQVLKRYPHQLSGGMQQRVMIAMALSTEPRLLILDEPTTALDVTTQAVILDLFRELILTHKAAALYVSHDLGTVAQLCDYVTVLYGGEIMESAPVEALYTQPRHPYTYGLLASLPSAAHGQNTRLHTIPGVAPSLAERSHACVFADRCPIAIDKCFTEKPPLETTTDGRTIRCWRWEDIANGEAQLEQQQEINTESAPPRATYVLRAQGIRKYFGNRTFLDRLLRRKTSYVHAVDNASLRVRGRSTLGLVGESGSGKTTLARAIVALEPADTGEIELCEVPISLRLHERKRQTLRDLQMVFQNPNDTLNPYQTIGQALARTIRRLSEGRLNRQEIEQRVINLLQSVRLTPEYMTRYPHELSGGEKQRIAIARAFAMNPALVVADEPTSSLDVSVQAVVLNLLKDLRAQHGVSYLFISHDLEVISYLADWIVVMYLGEIVEEGTNEQVYNVPSHPYTEALLSAIPLPDPTLRRQRIRLDGDIPSARDVPKGCRFHTRCPRKIGDICEREAPPLQDAGDGHLIRCHIPVDELVQLQQTEPERQSHG